MRAGAGRGVVCALSLVAATVVVGTGPASAGPPYTGDTELVNAPTSGETLYVDASVVTEAPVVAYEYAIQNECSFPARSGKSVQRDDIVYWTLDVAGVPHTTMPIYLQSVPTGSRCKVFLVRNNTTVKGTVTSYTVG